MPVYPPPSSGGGGGGTVVFQEEGSAVGTASIVNFVGSPTTVTHSGGTVTVTTTATSGIVIQEADGSPSGTATVLVFPNSTLSISNGTATYTASASSGASWTQNISEPGTSFANFSANSGTWASDGTAINQTDTGGATRRARHTTLVPGGLIWLLEVEALFVSTGTGNLRAGLLVGDPADTGHMFVYLERLGSGAGNQQVAVEREGAVQIKTYTGKTIDHSTWYKLRVAYNGAAVTVWLDGTLLGNTLMTIREDEVYPAIGSYGASVSFRNFKVWTLSGGLPS